MQGSTMGLSNYVGDIECLPEDWRHDHCDVHDIDIDGECPKMERWPPRDG